LATQFGLSSRTLTRKFILATGRGPQIYLSYARVRQAQRLFETTSEPMDSVRRAVGYQDAAAFRRAFKQTTGISPNEYRQAYGPSRHSGAPRIDSR
jgi:transcriptional regulator GlxA family with amidase domain